MRDQKRMASVYGCVSLGLAQSDRERALCMPPREIKYQIPRIKGYSGSALRKIRSLRGVGRPPVVSFYRSLRVPLPKAYRKMVMRDAAKRRTSEAAGTGIMKTLATAGMSTKLSRSL